MRVLLGIMARWLAQPATALHAPALTAPLPGECWHARATKAAAAAIVPLIFQVLYMACINQYSRCVDKG